MGTEHSADAAILLLWIVQVLCLQANVDAGRAFAQSWHSGPPRHKLLLFVMIRVFASQGHDLNAVPLSGRDRKVDNKFSDQEFCNIISS